jgi:methyl coenzyme M reductase beta subunit
MLEKFFIFRDVDSGNLTIEERAVIDPIPRGSDTNRLSDDSFCLVYSMTYSKENIDSAVKKGKSNLISTIRNRNFFPIKKHCEAIAEAIIKVVKNDETSVELFFDAKDLLTQAQQE